MDKIVYLFSDMNHNPLYVGCGCPDRPLDWFQPSICHAAAQSGSRFAVWMIEHGFEATWVYVATGLDFQCARETECHLIQAFGTVDEGGPLLNVHRGVKAELRQAIRDRKTARASWRKAKEVAGIARKEARETVRETRLEADRVAVRRYSGIRKPAPVGFTEHQLASIPKAYR